MNNSVWICLLLFLTVYSKIVEDDLIILFAIFNKNVNKMNINENTKCISFHMWDICTCISFNYPFLKRKDEMYSKWNVSIHLFLYEILLSVETWKLSLQPVPTRIRAIRKVRVVMESVHLCKRPLHCFVQSISTKLVKITLKNVVCRWHEWLQYTYKSIFVSGIQQQQLLLHWALTRL